MDKTPTSTITPDRSSFAQLPHDFFKYKNLLGLIIWRDIQVRYRQTVIGLFWVILQPATSALIFAFVFGHLVHVASDGLPYLVFVYSGTVIWGLFAPGIERSCGSILNDEQLIRKVYFPRWILPLASIGSTFIDFLVSLVLLFLCNGIFGIWPGWTFIFFIPAIAWALILTSVLGMGTAALCTKYRDFRFLITFLLQIAQFVSPVFYTFNLIPYRFLWLAYLNPMAGVIELFRLSLYGNTHFYLPGFCLSLVSALFAGGFCLKIAFVFEDELIDTI